MKLIKYNPLSWLIIAILITTMTTLYTIYNNAPINMIIKYILYNSPKLILLCLIDNKNIYDGFIFGTLFFILYLMIIDFNIKYVYYDQTIKKIIDSKL